MKSVSHSDIQLIPFKRSHSKRLLKIFSDTLNTDLGWSVHNCDDPKGLLDSLYEFNRKSGFFYTIKLKRKTVGFIGYRWSTKYKSFFISTYLSSEARGQDVNRIAKDLLINAFYVSRLPITFKIDINNKRSISANRKVLKKYGDYSVMKVHEKSSGKDFLLFVLNPDNANDNHWQRKHICFVAKELKKLIEKDLKIKEFLNISSF